ncbi:MAG TPA: hypothetical protein PLY78_04845 [Methanospirillum sp.]|nr:hypothetical protein [Methanospirillum sp.]
MRDLTVKKAGEVKAGAGVDHKYFHNYTIKHDFMGLRSDLTGIIPEDILIHLPDGYEIIGTIAIISIPTDLLQFQDLIVNALLSRRPRIHTIVNKTGDTRGIYRTSKYVPIYGKTLITEHKEYGFKYRLDISQVYFSSKMASERKRIADLIIPGETVFVPFAGVGPYAIPAAARGARVVAMEINKNACFWMAVNTTLNRVSSGLHIVQGDALVANNSIRQKFSRIIIPTPYGLLRGPNIFFPMLTDHGTVHWITFANKSEIHELMRELAEEGYHILRCHECGNVAPSVYRWIVDIKKRGSPVSSPYISVSSQNFQ